MKQTYTKEQLEALRDCKTRKICEGCIFCHDAGCSKDLYAAQWLADDLLSANEEIEKLRGL